MTNTNFLAWIDLEMTGLDPNAERIIEIFTAVTNEDLTEIIDGPNIVISQPQEYIDAMDDWNQTHHSASGLLDRIAIEGVAEREAEAVSLAFIEQYIEAHQAPLCGNSIWQDRRFLSRYMPTLERYLHYRMIDGSSV